MKGLREFGDLRSLAGLLVLGAVKGAALVALAEALARGIVAVIAGGDPTGAVVLGMAAAVVRGAVTWATHWWSTRSALDVKSRLRRSLVSRVLQGGGPSAGSTGAVGALGLDDLDEVYRTVLPAAATAAAVPLIAGARILSVDWVSALVLVLTVPLVPLFMVLVGRHAADQADAAASALDRFSHHLVELARGLPVLVGLGRLEQQAQRLERIGRAQRDATMRTLRSAFLSALVLELIATISVAVVAVFVGVRLVDGTLPLAVGLIALILAPECFQPFREVGAAFHASQDGLAALRRARAIVAEPVLRTVRLAGGAVRVTNLTVLRTPAVTALTAVFPRGSVTAITGESGAGKSTLLGVLAGTVPADAGTVGGIDPTRVGFVPQHPFFVGETVRAELERYAESALHVQPVLDQLGLTAQADAAPSLLSPGEARRVAVGRALLRVRAGAELLLLDEPTAHLDAESAERVLVALRALPPGTTVVLASHDAAVLRLADRFLTLGRQGGARAVAARAGGALRTTASPAVAVEPAGPELAAFVRAAGWRLPAAAAAGIGASLFAVALMALSGWLIVSASFGPPILLLLVAIVGVRFFGLGRAGLRYAERLLTHDAVLTALVDLRSRLWRGFAARGLSSRALATGGNAVDYLLSASTRVRDLTPRVLIPAAVAVGTSIAAVIAVAMLEPAAVPVLLATASVGLLLAPTVTLLADRAATRAAATAASTMAHGMVAVADAADDLRANGVAGRELDRLQRLDAAVERAQRRAAWALGLGDALVTVAATAGAVLMLTVAAGAGTPAPLVAVLALLMLALAEPLAGAGAAAQQVPALREALQRVRQLTAPVPAASGAPVGAIHELELDGVTVRWPGAGGDAFDPVDARVRRGGWLVLEGRSGAGKSTMLAALLRYLPVHRGVLRVNGMDAATLDADALRRRIAWCPQEAHLFDSTVRGNLLLAAPDADHGRLREALAAVGLGTLELDRAVGSRGQQLSGGQRQRLAVARALVAERDVVLLDEPTAHLDAATARALLHDLRAALSDRIVVMVTHHADDIAPGDAVVTLGYCATGSSTNTGITRSVLV